MRPVEHWLQVNLPDLSRTCAEIDLHYTGVVDQSGCEECVAAMGTSCARNLTTAAFRGYLTGGVVVDPLSFGVSRVTLQHILVPEVMPAQETEVSQFQHPD